MDAIGLIVEYNPLHNGHLYHIEQAKLSYPNTKIIAVMSGNFLQRGEPALLNKWVRTKLALDAGIDLIFELPYAHAVQKADQFAWHSVKLLTALNVKAIIFGSEIGSIKPFSKAYQQWMSCDIDHTLRPLERMKLLHNKTHNPVFASPNNTLGFWYYYAAKQQNSPVIIDTIQRKAADYHDDNFHGTIASATAIRQSLSRNTDYTMVVPFYTAEALSTQTHITWEHLYPKLRHILLTTPTQQISLFGLVSEGIEHRLQTAALSAHTFEDFLKLVKTKRYSLTHLQRICAHILTQTTQIDLDNCQSLSYLRLLGSSPCGFKYLRTIRKTCPLPIVTSLKQTDSLLATIEYTATLAYNVETHLNEFQRKPCLSIE